jgi:lysophospholipase L1-like esterase
LVLSLGVQNRRRIPLLLVGAVLLWGCSKSPTTPSPPPTAPEDPKITCPAPVTLKSPNGQPLPAVYGTATVVGGVAPVTTTCTPASGTQFAVGTTYVSCTATDSRQRADTCSLAVVVQPPPRISLTRFVAFGDSITLGEDGNTTSIMPMRRPLVILTGRQYPTVLQQQLAFTYTAQTILVANEGVAGEYASAATTLARFVGITATRAYDVVLIMEGSNDLDLVDPLAIQSVITNLRAMIRDARSKNVRPYIATVPPMNPLGMRGGGSSLVGTLNDQIRSLAFQEGITLVDINQAFGNNLSLLGVDGLHPNANGYALIADTFFQTLGVTLQLAPTSTATPFSIVSPVRR